MRRGFSFVALLLGAGCAGQSSSRSSQPDLQAQRGTINPLDAQAPGTEAPATEPSSVPELPAPTSLPQASLRHSAATFAKKQLQKPRRIGAGGILLPAIPNPDRIAIETLTHSGALLDVRSGNSIAEFAAPRKVSARAGVVVLDTQEPELVRLSDAKKLKPRLEAEDLDPKTRWLTAGAKHDRPVMLVEGRAGEKFVALPTDSSFEVFRAHELPLDKSSTPLAAIASDDLSWHFVLAERGPASGGTPWFRPHESRCVRAQLGAKEEVACIEYEPRALFAGARWLARGWAATDEYIAHASWHGKVTHYAGLVGEGPCGATLTIADPPRVFVQCRNTSALLAPDAVLRLDQIPEIRVAGLLGADAGPVVPLLAVGGDKEETEFWLDLPGKRRWHSERLQPLAVAAFAGVGTRALAANRQKEVFVLDFERGTQELVGKIDDCPGDLAELRDNAGGQKNRLVLACLTPPPAHMVTQFHIWSEILDLDTRSRYRTKKLPEFIFDDGMVVLSNRRKLSAETKDVPGEIFSAEIGAP